MKENLYKPGNTRRPRLVVFIHGTCVPKTQGMHLVNCLPIYLTIPLFFFPGEFGGELNRLEFHLGQTFSWQHSLAVKLIIVS